MIVTEVNSSSLHKVRRFLYTSGVAAILASACHHISFFLFTFGISESKIIYIITFADWARPFLIVVSLFALFISYLYIWHSPVKAATENANNQIKITDKAFFTFVVVLVLIVFMLPYFAPCTY